MTLEELKSKLTYERVIFILITIIAIMLLIGYCNGRKLPRVTQAQLEQVIKQKQQDSIAQVQRDSAFATQKDYLEGQIDLFKNRVYTSDSALAVERGLNLALIKKHKPIEPSGDTSITTVPNEYIYDCEGCFTRLAKTQSEIDANKKERDGMQDLYVQQSKVYDDQIKQLQKDRDSCNKRFNQMAALAVQAANNQETWKLKVGIGALSIGTTFPNSFGAGFLYEDLKGNDFGAHFYTGKLGPIYEIKAYKTISLKRKK